MLQFNIDEIEKRTLSGLKDFQRATVERVDYLFRHNQNRVLVADEVGMGKTLIARGAIVKTARLRIEEKDDLFKVIYICSNQNIANQNIRKLDVTGKNAIGSVSDTRLSMQHLSATPYKLYSTLEEIDENQLDEHYAEFFQVMNFLFDDEVKDIKFKEVWKNYSHALSELKAGDSAIIRMKELAENAMYQGVSRTERISVMDSGDYTDDSSVKHHLQIDENDINSYIQMSRLLSKTDSNHSLPVDYAKSCPYLMSFMKKYKIKEQIEKYYIKHPDEFGSEREQCLLWLNRNKINKYDELPKTNARLEALKEKAFTGGAEKYLWIPPSLPYYEMQGAYKNSKGFSKILVFSAWEMVPRMIGALVSYEAERLTVGKLVHQIKNQDKKNTGYFADGSRRYPVARLRFNVSNGEVRGMSLFALLYPSKTLSDIYSRSSRTQVD